MHLRTKDTFPFIKKGCFLIDYKKHKAEFLNQRRPQAHEIEEM